MTNTPYPDIETGEIVGTHVCRCLPEVQIIKADDTYLFIIPSTTPASEAIAMRRHLTNIGQLNACVIHGDVEVIVPTPGPMVGDLLALISAQQAWMSDALEELDDLRSQYGTDAIYQKYNVGPFAQLTASFKRLMDVSFPHSP